jgi:hypothetical protein
MGDSTHLGHQGELREGRARAVSVLMSDFAAVRPSALVPVAPAAYQEFIAMSRGYKEASWGTLEKHLVDDGQT